MDPERQPLLSPVKPEGHCSRYRPLSPDEVMQVRQEVSWRRIQFCLVLLFWGIMAMFLSIVTCILITTPKCNSFDMGLGAMPMIPPVHMSLAPLISTGRALTEDPSYTL